MTQIRRRTLSWLARRRRRLVVGPAGVQECLLGEGHDVDLPPRATRSSSAASCIVLHDGAHVHGRAVAQSERGLRPEHRRRERALILIAIMTFVLISSSGTMAMAVNYGYRRDRKKTAILMLVTAAFGATFVGMQAFEWTKLIMEGVRPWENPWGAAQFGSSFFMITGFHGTHVTYRRDFPDHHRAQGLARRLRRRCAGIFHEPEGATTRASRSWAFTGTSSISYGCSSLRCSICGEAHGTRAATHTMATAQVATHDEAQQHPIKLYLVVWGWLFVLSTCFYVRRLFPRAGISADGS